MSMTNDQNCNLNERWWKVGSTNARGAGDAIVT
jgi:hypothetical protein